jgi:hypothetical protein
MPGAGCGVGVGVGGGLGLTGAGGLPPGCLWRTHTSFLLSTRRDSPCDLAIFHQFFSPHPFSHQISLRPLHPPLSRTLSSPLSMGRPRCETRLTGDVDVQGGGSIVSQDQGLDSSCWHCQVPIKLHLKIASCPSILYGCIPQSSPPSPLTDLIPSHLSLPLPQSLDSFPSRVLQMLLILLSLSLSHTHTHIPTHTHTHTHKHTRTKTQSLSLSLSISSRRRTRRHRPSP